MPKILKQILGERISLPDETTCTISLSMPVFPDGIQGKEALSSFYLRLYEKVREKAVRYSCTVRSELTVASEDENGFSLVSDLFFYRGRNLLICHRFSDNRLWDGSVILPPRQIRNAIPVDGGWYPRNGGYVIWEKRHLSDEEKGKRRADSCLFFSETEIGADTVSRVKKKNAQKYSGW